MSFYRVVYEGNELWVPGTEDVIDPVVEVELNTAGRLTMTLLPNHPDFYAIQPLLGTVEVWEDNELIWFGRPVYQERTIKNHKPVYCEGALAYFNDSAQRPRAKGPVTAAALFADILSVHNSQVPANRQFAQGTVDVPSTEIIWENDYEESMHTLQTLLQTAGGYVIPRRSGSTNYLDYRYDLPLNDGQPIRFQLNMTDFNRRYSFEEKFTTVLPIGGVPEPTEQVPEPGVTTIAPVNAGSDILDGPDAATYGRIIKVLKYPIITDPQELYDTAARVLEYVEFHPISIHAKAVDLSMLDSFYQRFRVGCQYHVLSEAHDVDAWVPMTKLTIRMDRAVREIEVGTVRRAGLSEMLNRQNRQLDYLKQTFAPKVGGRDWNSRAEVSVNPRRYTVVFMNGDTVLQEVKNVAPGDSVTYSGQTPTRAGCEFTGWDKEAVNVHSNLVIYAQFTKLAYTVTFKNWDGATLAVVDDVPYDGTAVYPGETPTKEGQRFKGWHPLPVHIREDTVCVAQFFTAVQVTVANVQAAAALGYKSVLRYGLAQTIEMSFPNTHLDYYRNGLLQATADWDSSQDGSYLDFSYDHVYGRAQTDNVGIGWDKLYAVIDADVTRSVASTHHGVGATMENGEYKRLEGDYTQRNITKGENNVIDLTGTQGVAFTGYPLQSLTGRLYLPVLE